MSTDLYLICAAAGKARKATISKKTHTVFILMLLFSLWILTVMRVIVRVTDFNTLFIFAARIDVTCALYNLQHTDDGSKKSRFLRFFLIKSRHRVSHQGRRIVVPYFLRRFIQGNSKWNKDENGNRTDSFVLYCSNVISR
jgi:hypothetical protein